MADGSTIIKADISVSHIDSQDFLTRSEVIAVHQAESHQHLVQRLLAWAIFRHHQLQMSRAICVGDEPDLFVKRNDVQFEHWIEVDQLSLDRLEKAEAKSEHLWLFYCDQQKAQKLHKLINKHPSLQLVEIDNDMVENLSLLIEKNLAWSVMIDHDLLTVAAGDAFFESKLTLFHPLTVPAVDLIH